MTKSGISMHLKGYDSLIKIIELSMKEPDKKIGELEIIVATEKGVVATTIDRSIRTAIQTGYGDMDKNVKTVLFGDSSYVPSTGKFVKSVSYALRNGLLDEM